MYLNVSPTELANRKILEEIQLKKQQILKQGVAPSLNSPTITPSLSAVGTAVTLVSLNLCSFFKIQVNLQGTIYLDSFFFFFRFT
jgi:hypothetical protein